MTTQQLFFAIAGLIGVSGIISGLVMLFIGRKMKRLDENSKCRREGDHIMLRGLFAIGGLANATAEACKLGYANGHVTAAMEEYSAYSTDLQQFLIEQYPEK